MMKTYNTAREVKAALLNCETVKIKGWVATINDNDDIEVSSPNGVKTANDICHLDMAVSDFLKEAGGMPDKTPAPVSFDSIPSGSGPLGDDSTSDSPWSDPKVNAQPVPQGATSDPGLGSDTTGDKPWVDPAVVKLPQDSAQSTLPDTNLGSDTEGNPTNWGESKEAKKAAYVINFGGDDGTYETWDNAYSAFKQKYADQAEEKAKALNDGSTYRVLNILAEESIEKVAQENDSTLSIPSEDSEDKSPYNGVEGDILLEDEQVASLSEFHSAGIIDTYAEPTREPTYREMLNASPSADLLRDIADTDKWAARQLLAMDDIEDLSGDEEEDEDEVEHLMASKQSSVDYIASIREAIHGKKAQDTSLVEYIKEAVSTENIDSIDDILSRGVQLEVIAQLAEDYGAHQVTAYVQQMKDNTAGFGAAATRIRENWGQDGAYSRDMDAETAEDLYHLTRSLGQEDSYDWAGARPSAAGPGQEIPLAPGGLAEVPVDTGVGSMSTEKMAVDEAAKSYWVNYYKDYGKQLVKDNDSKKDKKDPEKKENVKADRSIDDKYEPSVSAIP